MLKETITYKDFNGVEKTEDFYFNLTQFEATELSVSLPDRITDRLKDVDENSVKELADELSKKEIMEFIKTLVLKSYGLKSKDGSSFYKSEEETTKFAGSNAFSVFMMGLLTNDMKASNFINAVIPSELASKMNEKTAGTN